MKSQLTVCDLGADQEYGSVLALQEQLWLQRTENAVQDTLILVEHQPVFTLGRSADHANLLTSPARLAQRGVGLFEIKRGGDITFHGPGQLVGYPIIKLTDNKLRLLEFVNGLEEVLIQTAAHFNLSCNRDQRNRGVWVGNSKLAAIGIHVSHQVTMHGFAFNVNTKLAYYQEIVPCGLHDAGVTSMAELTGATVNMELVKKHLVTAFKTVFNYS